MHMRRGRVDLRDVGSVGEELVEVAGEPREVVDEVAIRGEGGRPHGGSPVLVQRHAPRRGQELEEARRMDDNPGVLEMLAGTYAAAGRPDEARRITEEMVKRSQKRYVCAYEVATTYAGLKDRESAFLWLRKSLDERADCSPWIAADPKLDPLRADPRFQDLLRRLGLPQ